MSYVPLPIPLPIQDFPFYVQETGMANSVVGKIVNVMGFRTQWASTTAQGDICAYLAGGQDRMNIPNSATTYYLVSTSTQDATGGSGVDTVRIIYLDSSGVEQVLVATLNGTTPVLLGSGFSFVQWMQAYHSTVPDRATVGEIAMTSTNGTATEATTVEMIQTGTNRSSSCRYKVPSNKQGYIMDYSSEANGTSGTAKLLATIYADNGALCNTFTFFDQATLKDGTTHSSDLHYMRVPPNAMIKATAIPAQLPAGNRFTASIHLLITGLPV